MFYLQTERKRYQSLVIYIIQYFTKINQQERMHQERIQEDSPSDILNQLFDRPNQRAFNKLFGNKSDRD